MPRPHAILQNHFPYHVTGRCINKEWFKIPLQQVWEIFCEQLTYIAWVYSAEIHSFVLMQNHFHLIVSTPDSNLSQIMATFMRETTRQINFRAGRINQAYGARHFRTVVASDHYYFHVYKYVYQNPLRAGLCTACEYYPYSSLNFLLGGGVAKFPISEDKLLFSNVDQTLSWINEYATEDNWDVVKKALQKKIFRLPKESRTKQKHGLEHGRL